MIFQDKSKYKKYYDEIETVCKRAEKYVFDKTLTKWYADAVDMAAVYKSVRTALAQLSVELEPHTIISESKFSQLVEKLNGLMPKLSAHIENAGKSFAGIVCSAM